MTDPSRRPSCRPPFGSAEHRANLERRIANPDLYTTCPLCGSVVPIDDLACGRPCDVGLGGMTASRTFVDEIPLLITRAHVS
jgi:hypothetical protein